MKKQINILDIPIFSGDLKLASAIIQDPLEAPVEETRCISLTGAHGLVYSRKNPEFKEVLSSFYLNLPDGMPTVWIGKLKGKKEMGRCYGPDLFKEVMTAAASKNVKHFLCGGRPGVAEELKVVCREEFNNFNIAGTFSPPFREMTDNEFSELSMEISSKKVDIVWIGISTPKQELFAKKLSEYVKVKFIITVGAAFDFHTKKIKQAPKLIQHLGLEWFFRLLIEPKRLWRRYAEVVPSFIFFNLQELLAGRFFN